MVKMTLLKTQIPYRVQPPMIAPETYQNPKKGQAYVLLTPSVQDTIRFMSTTTSIKFRNLYKYYIDKKWTVSLYRQGRQIIKPDETGEITDLLNKNKRGNLSKVDGVTSFLPTNKSNVLKDLNVLVEVGYVAEKIISNPQDTRLISYRVDQYTSEIKQRLVDIPGLSRSKMRYTKNVIIPMDLWFTEEEYKSPAKLIKSVTKNPMARFLQNTFHDMSLLKEMENLYLIHNNVVLKINAAEFLASQSATDPDPTKILLDLFQKFMVKARMSPAEDVPTAKEAATLKEAERETKAQDATDSVIKKAKIDPDKISAEDKEKIQNTVKRAIPDPTFKEEPVHNDADEVVDTETELDIPKGTKVEQSDDVDDLLAAKMKGESLQNYKRNQMLKEKYKELKLGDVPLESIIKEDEEYNIPELDVKAHTVNDDMKQVRAARFDEAYNEQLAKKDLTNILLHFSHVDPALYINKDIQVTDASTPTDRMIRYTVEFESEDRKRHRFPFLLPKMYKEKYLFLNDQKMNLLHQKLPFPVTKVSPEKCQAVTSYKKIFTERYGSNLSPRVTRLTKLLTSPGCPKSVVVEKGNALKLNATFLTTLEYDELSTSIVRLTVGNRNNMTRVFFDLSVAYAVIPGNAPRPDNPVETQPLYPIAVMTKHGAEPVYFYLSPVTNFVYQDNGTVLGELSEFIIKLIEEYDPKITEMFANISTGTKFIYSRSRVMDENVPTILMLAAADPGGLTAVLEKAKVEYGFVGNRKDVPKPEDKDSIGTIPFEDGILWFNRYPFERSLLMNGLNTFPTKMYSFYDLNTRDALVNIFDGMFGRRNLYDSLRNFYYMFVDPITADILVRLNMPTDFTRLILFCNDILVDNSFQIDSDYHNSRIRSNEIIYAHLYRFLAEAWGNWRTGRQEKFSIREDAVIKELLTSNIVDPHSELNIMLETENDRQVKLKGPSGMNEDRSFTLEKRAYHNSMQGILGMNTTASGEVGISRHLVLNPEINDSRGFITVPNETDNRDKYTGTELATPAELMQAFGPESCDIERLAMSISQSKHVVPVAHSVASPISYDMERVIPYISTDYAQTAKKDGKVVAIENDVMIIQYKDGTYDDVDLSERPAKNTDGGFYIMNQFITPLKVGQSVKSGQLVAYDPKYINGTMDTFGDPVAVMGTMARVAVETNGGVYEDACYITDKLAHRMTTKITKQKRVILSRFANIKYIVKIGQTVQTNDPILTFDDTEDEFSSQMLARMAEEAGDDDEVMATNAPIVSKVTGVIRDIRIYYTIDPTLMTPSMQKVLKEYNTSASKREKTISKYMNLYDANTLVKTSEQLQPDSAGKVKGVKINDGIMIDFYIEYEDVMSPGDKLSYFSALKGVVSNVIPDGYEPYTEGNPDRPIDAVVSAIGMYKRMCLDFFKVGALCKVTIEKKRQLADAYLDRCKAELKK